MANHSNDFKSDWDAKAYLDIARDASRDYVNRARKKLRGNKLTLDVAEEALFRAFYMQMRFEKWVGRKHKEDPGGFEALIEIIDQFDGGHGWAVAWGTEGTGPGGHGVWGVRTERKGEPAYRWATADQEDARKKYEEKRKQVADPKWVAGMEETRRRFENRSYGDGG